MASFNPQKIDLSQINEGVRYENGDGLRAESINSAIEASAFAQSLATNQPDTSGASEVGTPSVSITYGADGTPRFSFKRLKGEKGDSGLDYGASLSNEFGESDVNGYTQKATNSLLHNPNILINGNFDVWQRGTEFSNKSENFFSADRWRTELGTYISINKTADGLELRGNKSYAGITQKIETTDFLREQKLTLSVLVKSSYECYGIIRYKKYSATGAQTLASTQKHTGNGTWQLLSCTFDFSTLNKEDIEYIVVKFQGVPEAFSFTLKYVKLEVGSVATPCSPRPYAEELAMCQRYYQVFENTTNLSAHTDGTEYAVVNLNTIAKMRGNPTIETSTANGLVIVNGGAFPSGGISFNSYVGNNLEFKVTMIDKVKFGFAIFSTGGKFSLDAEIY